MTAVWFILAGTLISLGALLLMSRALGPRHDTEPEPYELRRLP